MKAIEALQLNQSCLSSLLSAGIKMEDIQYLPLYKEYNRLKDEGHKVTYVVYHLAQEYNLSERTVYAIMKKFDKPI